MGTPPPPNPGPTTPSLHPSRHPWAQGPRGTGPSMGLGLGRGSMGAPTSKELDWGLAGTGPAGDGEQQELGAKLGISRARLL